MLVWWLRLRGLTASHCAAFVRQKEKAKEQKKDEQHDTPEPL